MHFVLILIENDGRVECNVSNANQPVYISVLFVFLLFSVFAALLFFSDSHLYC